MDFHNIAVGVVASGWFLSTALFFYLLHKGNADLILHLGDGELTWPERLFCGFVAIGLLIAIGRLAYDCLAWTPYDWGYAENGEWNPARPAAAFAITLFAGLPLLQMLHRIAGQRFENDILQTQLSSMSTIATAHERGQLTQLIAACEREVIRATYLDILDHEIAATLDGQAPQKWLDDSEASCRRRAAYEYIIVQAKKRLETLD